MPPDPKLPRGSLRLAAEAIEDAGDQCGNDWATARVALTAALPVIQRDTLRQAARQILALCPENDLYGSYYMMRRCLKGLARGEPLPDVPPKESTDD